MAYQGVIKGSRTLDLAMVSQIIDGVALGLLFYSPEQTGIPVLAYAGVRAVINGLQAYLRFQTKTPVGEKDV